MKNYKNLLELQKMLSDVENEYPNLDVYVGVADAYNRLLHGLTSYLFDGDSSRNPNFYNITFAADATYLQILNEYISRINEKHSDIVLSKSEDELFEILHGDIVETGDGFYNIFKESDIDPALLEAHISSSDEIISLWNINSMIKGEVQYAEYIKRSSMYKDVKTDYLFSPTDMMILLDCMISITELQHTSCYPTIFNSAYIDNQITILLSNLSNNQLDLFHAFINFIQNSTDNCYADMYDDLNDDLELLFEFICDEIQEIETKRLEQDKSKSLIRNKFNKIIKKESKN